MPQYLTGMPGLLAPQSPAAMFAHPAPLATTGKIIFVSSVQSGRGNDNIGDYPLRPKATLAGALLTARANRGDQIWLMPGHAETIRRAAQIDVNVAGVSIFGLGHGAQRPTFTFETARDASILFSATSCRMLNVIGVPNIADLTQPFDVTGSDCALHLEWQDASATLDARRAVLATSVRRLAVTLKYLGFTNTSNTLNAIQLNGCSHVDIHIDAYGYAWSAWVEFVTMASTNVKVKGSLYTSEVKDGTHNVSDTVGDSTWQADIFDAAAGVRFLGGSGRALYEAWRGTASMLSVLGALGVTNLSEDIDELTEKVDRLEESLQDALE